MSKMVSRIIRINRNVLAAWAVLTVLASAAGALIESDAMNADGSVTYTYLVDNSAGTFEVAAWSLEFGFSKPDWIQTETSHGGDLTVPAGWVADIGTPSSGQSAQDFLSLGTSSDVAVGQELAGFSFTSKFLPGPITFSEFSADGDSFSGIIKGPAVPADPSVPDGGGPLEPIAFVAIVAFAAATQVLPQLK